MHWFLYILLCDNKSYYVGITKDLDKRVSEHVNKESRYTKRFNDIELVYTEKFKTETEVVKREKQIKGWSFNKKKSNTFFKLFFMYWYL